MNKRFDNLIINTSLTVSNAMKKLEFTGETLYVVDNRNKLIGSLSNGDIRKGILKGVGINESIESIINYSPRYVFVNQEMNEIREMLLELGIDSIPVVDKDLHIIDIVDRKTAFGRLKHFSEKKYEDIKVFTLAGGFGTRLEPFTKILPKPLIPIGDRTIIEKIMDRFKYHGFNNFVLSLNYKAEMIKLYLNDPEIKCNYENIDYIVESKPLGTIGSLYLAKQLLTNSFFITNCDVIVEANLEEILNFHKSRKNILTIIGCVKNSVIPYGVLDVDDKDNLISIHEKPTFKSIINTGVYVAEPEIVNYLEEDKKVDMTQLIELLINKQKDISVYPVFEDQWLDIGHWAEYEKTRKHFEKNL